MPHTRSEFEKHLSLEILKSEKLRARVFFFIILFIITDIILVISIFHDKVVEATGSLMPIYHLMAAFLFMAIREFNIGLLLNKAIRERRIIPKIMQHGAVLVEITIPTVLLVVLSYSLSPLEVLNTPVIMFYFIIILLTTLSLDFKISLFAGITAGLQYFALVIYWVYGNDGLYEQGLLGLPYLYYGKAMILIGSGGIAGFIARQLKKQLEASYKFMSERNEIKNMFGQQVSQEIVEELTNNSEVTKAKRLFVCVMFLDIRGFTPFAEKLEPEELIEYQNLVFGFMIDEIIKNHGIINQFLGDGYMATFGAPVSSGSDCLNAYKSACEIVRLVNKKSEAGEIPKTRIGIGLHAGYVVAGNVGTDQRKQYSISGNTVILAARLEQLNKTYSSQLLISKEVLEQIGKVDEKMSDLGPVNVKGRENPVNIYKVF